MNDQSSALKKVRKQDVLDNLPGLVFRVVNDGQWTFAYANKGAKRLLGYTASELVNLKNLRKMVPEKDQARNKKLISALSPENPNLTSVYRLNVASGKTKWVREEATGFFSPTGRLLYLDGFLVDITDQKMKEESLLDENIQLRSNLKDKNRFDNIIGESIAMKELFDLIMKAADTNAAVVLTGETGTGKELVSRAIHRFGCRKDMPFVVVNCGAIAENLLESEFFGYRKGSFTGALNDRQGFLDAANNGTLFLDELGEISKNLQVKLLRVLDGEGYIPVGETKPRHADFRLIAATNSNLEDLVRTGKMREDFYYRINTFRLRTPPLRERKEDIILLANHFLAKFSQEHPPPRLSPREKSLLLRYRWPGNVRELQSAVYRYLIHGTLDLPEDQVIKMDSKSYQASESETDQTVFSQKTSGDMVSNIEEMEKRMIWKALEHNFWHIGKSAEALGISRRTMQRRMKKYHLKK